MSGRRTLPKKEHRKPAVPKLKLRNAYLRGWFAARADRSPPEPDGLGEKPFIDRGFEAGVDSGGQALPMLQNPRVSSTPVSEVDIEAVLQEYRARKLAAQQDRAPDGGQTGSTPSAPASAQKGPADVVDAAIQSETPAGTKAAQAPTLKPRKSRWDDGATETPAAHDSESGASEAQQTHGGAGRKRRYGK